MQKSLIEMSQAELIEVNARKNKLSCNIHYYAHQPEDFIEVIIKNTGEKKIRCRFCIQAREERKKIQYQDWQNEKEKISDKYVLKTLKQGKNSLPTNLIPPILIEAKRAVIQLKRLKEKMEEPLKTCSSHGKLYHADVIKAGKSKWTGEQQYKCRQCMKEMHAKHYQLNKAKVLASHAKYRKENPVKVAQSKRKWRQKNELISKEDSRKRYEKWERKNPAKAKELQRQYKIKSRLLLKDAYVARTLNRSGNLINKDIPPALIELQRTVLMLKRSVKLQTEQNKILKRKEELNEQNN